MITPPRKVALVSQTTKNVDELMKFAMELQCDGGAGGWRVPPLQHHLRADQRAPERAARLVEQDQVDLILAIGGRKSSNTARLAEVGNSMGVDSLPHRAARGHRARRGWSRRNVVGITAGASTPDDVIEDVVAYLAERGYEPPEGGIRKVDPDYVPAY